MYNWEISKQTQWLGVEFWNEEKYFSKQSFLSKMFPKDRSRSCQPRWIVKKGQKEVWSVMTSSVSHCSFFSFMWSCSLGSLVFYRKGPSEIDKARLAGWQWHEDRSEYFCINTTRKGFNLPNLKGEGGTGYFISLWCFMLAGRWALSSHDNIIVATSFSSTNLIWCQSLHITTDYRT